MQEWDAWVITIWNRMVCNKMPQLCACQHNCGNLVVGNGWQAANSFQKLNRVHWGLSELSWGLEGVLSHTPKPCDNQPKGWNTAHSKAGDSWAYFWIYKHTSSATYLSPKQLAIHVALDRLSTYSLLLHVCESSLRYGSQKLVSHIKNQFMDRLALKTCLLLDNFCLSIIYVLVVWLLFMLIALTLILILLHVSVCINVWHGDVSSCILLF